MTISFTCPRCSQPSHARIDAGATDFACRNCGRTIRIPADACRDGHLHRCLACPSTDLYVRKDFPQQLGVMVVVAGFAVSCVFWYLYMPVWAFVSLFVPALVDFVLFLIVGDALMCYRCGAVYRGVAGMTQHGPFSLETHERHRQQTARWNQLKAEHERTAD